MTQPDTPSAQQADRFSIRDVLVIVAVGVALGVGFNAMQLQADPGKGLSWVKTERALAKLELESHAPPAPMVPVAEAATQPAVTAPDPNVPPANAMPAPAPATNAKPAPGAATPRPAATAPAGTPPAPAPTPATTAAVTPPADLPVVPDSREPIEAGLEVVRKFHAAGGAVIVDARSAEEYAEGHIAGAINLPFDDVFKKPELAKSLDTRGRPIITYCGGGDCELSRSLAFSFIDAGQRKVLVFMSGLPAWQGAGLAVHTGAQP